jgi:hypothetical protein
VDAVNLLNEVISSNSAINYMAVGCKITSYDIKTIILDHTKNSRDSSKKFGKQIENEI